MAAHGPFDPIESKKNQAKNLYGSTIYLMIGLLIYNGKVKKAIF